MGDFMRTLHIFWYIFLSSLFINPVAQAFVYATHLLVHPVTQQRIILMSDYHDACEASGIQRRSILDAAQVYNAYILAEDNGYRCLYAGHDGALAAHEWLQPVLDYLIADPVNFDANTISISGAGLGYEIDQDITPLLLLTHLAHDKGIQARTVECRQAEKISFQGGPISACQVCKAYKKSVDRLQRYDDGAVYNAYYAQQLKTYRERYEACADFFAYLEKQESNLREAFSCKRYRQSVWDVYKKIEYDNYVRDFMMHGVDYEQAHVLAAQAPVYLEEGQNLYKAFFMYLYNFLIDTSIIHEIAYASLEPIIFVYCGSMHVQGILPVLQAAGYTLEKVYNAKGNTQQSALNLNWLFNQIDNKLIASKEAYEDRNRLPYSLMDLCHTSSYNDMLTTAYFNNNPGLSVHGISLEIL
jgi:hypothetical protein